MNLDKDDGYVLYMRGHFDSPQKSDGIGVVGMRECVVTLGGEFNMTSSPSNGTQIEARLPIESPQKRRKDAI